MLAQRRLDSTRYTDVFVDDVRYRATSSTSGPFVSSLINKFRVSNRTSCVTQARLGNTPHDVDVNVRVRVRVARVRTERVRRVELLEAAVRRARSGVPSGRALRAERRPSGSRAVPRKVRPGGRRAHRRPRQRQGPPGGRRRRRRVRRCPVDIHRPASSRRRARDAIP